MLKQAIELGFKHDLKDIMGRTPYDYAQLQRSGILRKVFEEMHLAQPEEVKMEEGIVVFN